MAQTTQDYSNHVRWHPAFHFILGPIILIHLGWSIFRLITDPSFDHAEQSLLAIGLIVMALLVRTYPLRVQDRVIRLEEQHRYRRVLPADLAAQATSLPERYVVALRFASDEELGEHVKQVIDGKVSKPDEIKKAIKSWRSDYLRV